MLFFRQTLPSVCLIFSYALCFAQPPDAVDDLASGDEDTEITIEVLGNDLAGASAIDPASVDLDPSNPGIDQIFTIAGQGTFQADALGVVRFNPELNFNGAVTAISYTVSDEEDPPQVSDPATISVTVDAVNDAPTITATIGTQDILEDGATSELAFTIDDVDDDVNGLNLYGSSDDVGIIPISGIEFLGIGSGRSVVITPAADANGSVNITLNVSDDEDAFDQYGFDVNVAAVNDPPTITVSGPPNVNEDQALDGVTVTVSDVDNDAANFQVIATSNDENIIDNDDIGVEATGPERDVTAVPLANQYGPVTLTFSIFDGEFNAQAALDVEVVAVNDPPTVTPPGNQAINEDESTGILSFSVNDIDNDPASLEISGTSSVPAIIPNAPANINIVEGGSPTVEITPAPNQNGSVVITLEVSDGEDSALGMFTVDVAPVNDPPTFVLIPENQEIDENSTTGPLPVTIADIDTNPTAIELRADSQGEAIIPDGNIAVVGNTFDRTVEVTPAMDQSGGPVPIQLTIDDGEFTVTESFTVNVVAAADAPPTIDPIADQEIPEDGSIVNLPFTVGDPDGLGGLTLSATSSNNLVILDDDITINGAPPTPTISLSPVPNAFGTSIITVQVDDGTSIASTTFQVTVTSVNDPPDANNDNAATNEDTPVTFNVTTNDSDPDGSINVATVDLDPGTAGIQNTFSNAAGSWSAAPSGEVTYTPTLNYTGPASVTYQVNDNDGAPSNIATFAVAITAVNDPPEADDDNAATNEDTQVTFNVTTNDTDPDGTINAATVDLDPGTGGIQNTFSNAAGGWSAAPSGEVTYTPTLNYTGPASVTYRVNDNNGAPSNTATFAVAITAVNDPPEADDDNAATNEDTPVTFNVTANDSDPDGSINVATVDLDPGTAGIQNTFSNTAGSWSAAPSGEVTYTPTLNYTAPASVTYRVNDNNGAPSNIATFTVTISNDNDPPQANNDNAATNEDTPVTFNVTANDSDPDGSINVATVDLDPGTAGIQNMFSNAAGDWSAAPSGAVTYTPTLNYTGPASVTYRVNDNDGAPSNIATFAVAITAVNDPPEADDDNAATNEDTQVTFNVTTNDTDPDGTINVATVDLDPGTGGIQNTFSNAAGGWSAAPSGEVTYTPTLNYTGPASVTYRVNDNNGAPSNTATFAVAITAVNDPPEADDDNAATNEDTPVTFNVTANDSDPDGSINVATVDLDPGTAGIQNTFSNAAGSWSAAPSGEVTYTPTLNYTDPASVTYRVNDNNGAPSNIATFTVTISNDNDPPQANNDNAATNEDTPVTFNVTANDSDPDGTVNAATVDLDPGTAGIQNMFSNAAGDWSAAPSGAVTYTPTLNYTGPASVSYRVNDNDGAPSNIATFAVAITAVNDPPEADDDNAATNEDTQVTFNVTTNDTDPDGTINVATVDLDPGTGGIQNTFSNAAGGWSAAPSGEVTYTPTLNYTGPASVTYRVNDNNGAPSNTATFAVAITAVNDPPTITSIANQTVNEDVPTNLLAFTVGDAETAAADLIVSHSSDNTGLVPDANIALTGTGANRTVQVTPALNQSGVAIITLTVSDGVNSASTNFQVTVNTVNDAPTVSAIADQLVNEDTPTNAIAFTIGDVETAPGSLTVTASSGNTVLIPNGNILLGGSGANRTVQAAPAANQSGNAVITINVSDGVNTTSINFQVTVNAVNDPSTITPIADQTVNEDNATAALAFTLSDPDTPVAALTLAGTSDNTALVPNGNIVFGGSGGSRTVTVTPVANQSGTAVITVTVNDGTNDTPTSFQLNVTAVNDAPVIADQIPVSTNEEQPFDVEFGDLVVTDPDNTYPDDFTLEVLGNPGYTFSGATVTPNANVTGNMVVRVRVSDGTAQSNIFNLQVTVNAINDPPVITAQNPSPLIINEDGSVTVQLNHLTIVDPDNTSGFTLTLADGANYSVSGNVVTPDANYNGTLSVPVTVSDGTATSASFPLQIQVNPINDVPQITGQASITIAEVQPVALDLSQLTVFDPDNDYPDDFTLAILSGPNYSITGNTVIPVPNFSGTLLVRVFVNDGVANSAIYNLQISVNSTNDAPVITGQNPLSTDEGEPITITINDVTVNDPDNTYPDDFTLIILPGPKYTFSGNVVTPNPDVEGVISVSVKVNDGEVDSAPYNLQLTINGINNAPVITGQQPLTTPEDFPVTLKLADLIVTDPDSPFPTGFTMTASPGENYTLSGLTVTPAVDFNGSLSVPVTVSDGQLTSAVFNLEVVVSPVNDPPVINGHQPLSTLEDQAIVLKLADLNVTDVDNTFPTGFTLTVPAGSGATYTVSGTTVTPVANFIGTLSVPVVVSDGALSTSGTVEITVESVNDAPTLNAINNVTIQEDPLEQFTVALAGISSGPGEASQTVTVTASTNKPEWFEKFEVQYSGGATGSLAIKPKPNQFGTASITVRVQDSGPNSPAPNVNFFERTFNFIIEPVNDPPTITSTPLTIAETNQEYSYLIVAEDIEGEEITFGAPVLPAWLSLSQNANGSATLTGTPPPGTTGQIAVILQVKDPAEGSITTQEFQITVNSRPVISSFAIATDEEVTYTLGPEFAANFTDPDANPLSEVEITRLPVNGTLTLNGAAVALNQKISAAQIGNLELKYAPLKDATGMDTLSWNGSDGIFYSNTTQNVFITIRPVNDPPEIIALESPESDTLKYELGSERPIQLTRIFDAIDVDGDDIMSAQISFSVPQEYYTLEDQFIFKDTLGIVRDFDETLGILTLSGRASVANYVAAIRSIKYNLIVAPIESRANVGDNRRVSIKLSDGIAFGGTKERLIGLTNTFQELDIATAFTPTGANPVWNIYSPNGLEQYKDAIIRVYNKRGTLVYEARGFNIPWNGDGPEGALPADSYFYTIDLKYDKKKYKGVVTILR